jgi:chromosome segregation ATPase
VCRRVADLFQSVQLNVNNPHFLIMQGRVTKVSNSSPAVSSEDDTRSGISISSRYVGAAVTQQQHLG